MVHDIIVHGVPEIRELGRVEGGRGGGQFGRRKSLEELGPSGKKNISETIRFYIGPYKRGQHLFRRTSFVPDYIS